MARAMQASRSKRIPRTRDPLTRMVAIRPAASRASFASTQPWNIVAGVRMRRQSPSIGCTGQGPAAVTGPRTCTASPPSSGARVQVASSSAQR
jgi:hypothetical protein